MGVQCNQHLINEVFTYDDNFSIENVFDIYDSNNIIKSINSSTGIQYITSKRESLLSSSTITQNTDLSNVKNKKLYLIKCISYKCPNDKSLTQSYDHSFEIYQQRSIIHPNVMQPHKIYINDDKVQMVQDQFPQNVLLTDLIAKNDFDHDPKACFDILSQMLGIVKFFHSSDIMHRNLNPDCFLLNRSLNKLFIFDLGTCCKLEKREDRPITNLMFSSPELLNDKSMQDKNFQDEKTDIQSIGIIQQTLLQGHSPYSLKLHCSPSEIKHKVINSEFIQETENSNLNGVNKDSVDLYKMFIKTNSEQRGNIDWYLEHPLFKLMSDKKDDFEKYKFQLNNCINLELHQMFPNIIGSQFQLQPVVEVNKLQNAIDVNKDGQLDKIEIEKIFNKFPNIDSRTLTNKLFIMIDYDNNGIIDYKDFSIMTQKFNSSTQNSKNFQNLFKNLKIDSDFRVDIDNLFELLSIEDQNLLIKSNHFIKHMKSQDPIFQSINLDDLFENLQRGTDLEKLYKNLDWYKKIRLGKNNSVKRESKFANFSIAVKLNPEPEIKSRLSDLCQFNRSKIKNVTDSRLEFLKQKDDLQKLCLINSDDELETKFKEEKEKRKTENNENNNKNIAEKNLLKIDKVSNQDTDTSEYSKSQYLNQFDDISIDISIDDSKIQ